MFDLSPWTTDEILVKGSGGAVDRAGDLNINGLRARPTNEYRQAIASGPYPGSDLLRPTRPVVPHFQIVDPPDSRATNLKWMCIVVHSKQTVSSADVMRQMLSLTGRLNQNPDHKQ